MTVMHSRIPPANSITTIDNADLDDNIVLNANRIRTEVSIAG